MLCAAATPASNRNNAPRITGNGKQGVAALFIYSQNILVLGRIFLSSCRKRRWLEISLVACYREDQEHSPSAAELCRSKRDRRSNGIGALSPIRSHGPRATGPTQGHRIGRAPQLAFTACLREGPRRFFRMVQV